jgi:hypothetical protein
MNIILRSYFCRSANTGSITKRWNCKPFPLSKPVSWVEILLEGIPSSAFYRDWKFPSRIQPISDHISDCEFGEIGTWKEETVWVLKWRYYRTTQVPSRMCIWTSFWTNSRRNFRGILKRNQFLNKTKSGGTTKWEILWQKSVIFEGNVSKRRVVDLIANHLNKGLIEKGGKIRRKWTSSQLPFKGISIDQRWILGRKVNSYLYVVWIKYIVNWQSLLLLLLHSRSW